MTEFVSRRREGVTRRMRLKDHDYSEAGYYFLTATVLNGLCLFGTVLDGSFAPSSAGEMIDAEWLNLADRFPRINLDTYCVMPNHFHAIIGIGIETSESSMPNSVPQTMQAFKSRTSVLYGRGVRQQGWAPYKGKLWHRGYHDHIIRTERELDRIRDYIESNPSSWNSDRFYIFS